MKAPPDIIIITVVGGAGTTTKKLFGEVVHTFIDGPAGATYGYQVQDARGKIKYDSLVPIIDDAEIREPYFLHGNMDFKIRDSDHDGNFEVTVDVLP